MRHNDPIAALAPHVDPQWRERFMTEMTLRGASTTSAADALVEVETHCRESATNATDAFGAPATYARDLDLHDRPAWTRAQLARTGAKIILLVGGVWAAYLGASSLAAGQQAQVSAGAVVSAAATIAMIAVLMLLAAPALRLFIDHRAWFVLALLVPLTVIPLVGAPFDDIMLASVAALPTLAVGVAATAASLVWTLRGIRASSGLYDPRQPSNPPPGAIDR